MQFDVDPKAGALSVGRNGAIKTTGIYVSGGASDGGRVSISPITSRGDVANCDVTMTHEAMTQMAIWWLFQRAPSGKVNIPIKNDEDGSVLYIAVEYGANGLWITLPGLDAPTVCVDLYHMQYHPYEGSAGNYPQVLLYKSDEDDPVARAMWKRSGYEIAIDGDAP